MIKRREFFTRMGAALGAASLLSHSVKRAEAAVGMEPLTLGIASYSFRAFDLETCLEMTKRLDVRHICLKSFHLPLEASPEEIKKAAEKVRAAGIELYGGGVIYMNTEAEVRQAFEYCRAAGMQMMIGVPKHELLDMVEQLAVQHDLIVAIHNHGPGDLLYPTPQSIYDRIVNRNRRLGICLDIGHAQRLGLDPTAQFRAYHDRIYDIHIKDVSAPAPEGTTVEIGRGVIDIPKFLKTVAEMHYKGRLSLEYEKDEKDPLPGAAESIGYLRGVMATW
ncbi:MAG: sugar phosphate isomerase/epimerase [candidate division KSB1 bacterium]|nr:sugar phosphate isomerase/epimerase [candidate division KSB1 bacterium]MDZ7345177.1 sugar phosphate isomerase/epimerase [candidate division KSB1 bacterium]